MAGCPYTWVSSLLPGSNSKGPQASQLRVSVVKENQTVVDVVLPAQSARWLIDLIPEDVMKIIRLEGIPIDEIQRDLQESKDLHKMQIFHLAEKHRKILVWLE